MAASLGGLGEREPSFVPARGVRHGGVLTAVPALLQHADRLRSVLLLLARVRNPEQLQATAPTLRRKLRQLTADAAAVQA